MSESCNKALLIIGSILFIAAVIIHFIFYFFFKTTDLSVLYENFSSSPIFGFYLSKDCKDDKYIIFHIWEGIKETRVLGDEDGIAIETIEKGKKEINKINGYYFCYKKIMTYEEFLNNNQIIKKNEKCGDGYKNCGIIDTLEQELCMPQDSVCPLYDVGIFEKKMNYSSDYIYNINANIYYNRYTYNNTNKKIIGKIILNEGQPCYDDINEKLWSSFISNENEKTKLQCKFEIFGKKTDDRYKKKGDISYYKLYLYNIAYNFFFEFPEKDTREKYVSLYEREFLGIDKECDEKTKIHENYYSKLVHYQNCEKILLLIEPIIIIQFLFFTCYFLCRCSCLTPEILLFIYFCFFLGFIICHIIFLSKIIHYNLSDYGCSDTITNEFLRKKNLNTKKTIIFTVVNLVIDILVIIFIFFNLIYSKCENYCDNIDCEFLKSCYYKLSNCFGGLGGYLKICWDKCKKCKNNKDEKNENNNIKEVKRENNNIESNKNNDFSEKGRDKKYDIPDKIQEKQSNKIDYNNNDNIDTNGNLTDINIESQNNNDKINK